MKRLMAAGLLILTLSTAQAQSGDLGIYDVHIVREGGGISVITGTATNETGHQVSHAYIEFTLYDSRGSVVGSANVMTGTLPEDAQWNFKAETAIPFTDAKLAKASTTR